MALALTAPVLAAIEDETIAHAWFIDLFTDEGTLRAWDKPGSTTFGGNTYEGLFEQWEVSGEIKLGSDLVPEPLTFAFDASGQDDNASFAGRLVDRQWHQRRIALTGVLFVPEQDFYTIVGPHLEWTGTMDTIEVLEVEGQQSKIILSCEGGMFRALDRNLTTCTDADQKRRDANDDFFKNVALKPQQDVPFGRSWSNIPGGPGRGSTGGGGGGVAGGSGRGGFSRLN